MLHEEALKFLGLSEPFTPEELKCAYRTTMQNCHVDHGGSQEDMARCVDAYSRLSVVPPNIRLDLGGYEEYVESVMKRSWDETKFTNAVVAALEAAGAYTLKVHGGGGFQRSGIPDLYVRCDLFHGWLELKVENRKVEPLQLQQIARMVRHGIPAMVLRFINGDIVTEYETEIDKITGHLWKELGAKEARGAALMSLLSRSARKLGV